MQADKEYLTIQEAADECGISVHTIRWWADQRDIGARVDGQLVVKATVFRAKIAARRATISATEAARKYGVNPNTIGNWCVAFDIATKVGCRWRVDEAKLDALIESRGIPSPSPARRLPATSDQGSAGE
jgi:hypothetical protein